MRSRAAGAAIAALIASSCHAVTFAPDAATIADATAAGVALALRGEGYPLLDYLVYQVPDARALHAADGCVDAVVAATPLERTRHAAYLATVEARAADPATARREADLADQTLAVIIYAHGETAHDERFTERFRDPRLIVAARDIVPSHSEASDPVDATYPLAGADRRRPVATLTWQFTLAGVADDATPLAWLRFTDACGQQFRIALPLAALR